MCKQQLDDAKQLAESEGNQAGVAAAAFGFGAIRGARVEVFKSHVIALFQNLISFGIGAAMQSLADNTKKRDSWNYGKRVVDTNAYIDYVLRAM